MLSLYKNERIHPTHIIYTPMMISRDLIEACSLAILLIVSWIGSCEIGQYLIPYTDSTPYYSAAASGAAFLILLNIFVATMYSFCSVVVSQAIREEAQITMFIILSTFCHVVVLIVACAVQLGINYSTGTLT